MVCTYFPTFCRTILILIAQVGTDYTVCRGAAVGHPISYDQFCLAARFENLTHAARKGSVHGCIQSIVFSGRTRDRDD